MASPETRVQELHLTLPTPPKPMAKYRPGVVVGNLLYVSGHGPAKLSEKTILAGKLGAELTVDQGKETARAVGVNILATIKATLGSLDRVKRVIKSLAFVNCTADFKEQPQVVNGYSELMAEVFGEEAGVGARSAVGTNALPNNIPVEIEAIFELVA